MPSRKIRNVQPEHVPEPLSPLLQLDNSSWTADNPSPVLQLDSAVDSDVQLGGLLHEDEDSPVKHEGGTLTITPLTDTPSLSQPDKNTHPNSPRSSTGHIRSPVLAR